MALTVHHVMVIQTKYVMVMVYVKELGQEKAMVNVCVMKDTVKKLVINVPKHILKHTEMKPNSYVQNVIRLVMAVA